MASTVKSATGSELRLDLRSLIPLGLWLAVSWGITLILFRSSWTELGELFSPTWYLTDFHIFVLFILLRCFVFIWFRRGEIWQKMTSVYEDGNKGLLAYLIQRLLSVDLVGVAILIVIAVPVPASNDLALFRILAVWLAGMLLIYGRISISIPAILLIIYGFAIVFPMAIERFAVASYSRVTSLPLAWITNVLGYN